MDYLNAAKSTMANTLREAALNRAIVYADVKPSRSGMSARVRLWYIRDGRLTPLRPSTSACDRAEQRAEVFRDAGFEPDSGAWKIRVCDTCRIFEAIAQAAHWAEMPDPYSVADAVRRELL